MAYAVQILSLLGLHHLLRKDSVKNLLERLMISPILNRLTLAIGLFSTSIWLYFFYRYFESIRQSTFFSMKDTIFSNLIIMTLILAILSLFFAITGYYLYSQEELLLQQQSYIYVLEELQDDIRTFQHDYKNVLSTLYLQSQAGDIESIRTFMKEHIYSFEHNTTIDMKQLNALNNVKVIEIKSLFITKIFELQSKGITLKLEVFQPIEQFEMAIEDAVRCLGILLDNAIEAVTNQPQPAISLIIFEEQGILTFILKNSITSLTSEQKGKLEQAGYSTKGQKRGLGLYSYRRIAEKYSNLMRQTIITDHEFQQIIKIDQTGS